MSKQRLEVFLNKILFELKTTNCFLAFIVESTTLKAPIEYFGGIKNYVDDFSREVWVSSIRSVFLDYIDEKKMSTFYRVLLPIMCLLVKML